MTDAQVTVRFVTKDEYAKFRIGDSPLAIPRKLGRYGLSEVINHLLGLEKSPQPFDFSINDHLIREPLSSFVASHNISVEDVITIEYMPAFSLGDERSTIQADAWVGSLSVCNTTQLLFAGCYDGSVQMSNCRGGSGDSGNIKIMAHDDPVRDVTCWRPNSSSTTMVATASKDQSVKLWKVTGGSDNASKGKKRDASGAERGATGHELEQVADLLGHTSSVEALAYYPDTSSNKNILFSGDGGRRGEKDMREGGGGGGGGGRNRGRGREGEGRRRGSGRRISHVSPF